MAQELTVRTRFAPSPTGFMHVGNLRTALYAYLLARSSGGCFILRIEDTDQARYVENAVEVIYNTLKQAGLEHDEGPDNGGNFGPYIQSERKPLYRQFAEKLVETGAAYYCFCDKIETAGAVESDVGYDGRCRLLDPETIRKNLEDGKPHVIRQKIDHDGSTTFTDLVFGDISIENKVLDDQILLKRDGMPTYNFANVVDDHLMEITHVVRGSEYLPSTPKYNLLYQAFGWDVPEYVHLPLIMGRGEDGTVSKLSKRHGAVSFENLVAEGYLPEAVINYIALLGWSPKNDREIFSLDELKSLFNVNGLNKSPAVFDYAKLGWMNGEYLKQLPPETFTLRAYAFAGVDGTPLAESWNKIAPLLQQRVEKMNEIPEKIAFLHQLPEYPVDLFNNKKSKSNPEVAKTILQDLIPRFEALPAWEHEALMQTAAAYAEERELKLALPMWGLRIALSGLPVTPGGPAEIMDILGRTESLRRLQHALSLL